MKILHRFWTCSHKKQIWKGFTGFYSRYIREITLTLNDVLYGVEDVKIYNLIFTAKTFVYNKVIPEDEMFAGFINHLHRLRDIEYQVAKDKHRIDHWAEKWCFLQFNL